MDLETAFILPGGFGLIVVLIGSFYLERWGPDEQTMSPTTWRIYQACRWTVDVIAATTVKVALGIAFLALIVYAFVAAFAFIDGSGWIPHSEETVITAQANWFIGESKDCSSVPLEPSTATVSGRNKGFAMSRIECDGGPEHRLNITFYGRTEQPEYVQVQWKCTRESEGLTCKELSGISRGN
jgi:hypothetical protein